MIKPIGGTKRSQRPCPGCESKLGVMGLSPAETRTEADAAIVLVMFVKVVVYDVISAGFTPSSMNRIAISSTA